MSLWGCEDIRALNRNGVPCGLKRVQRHMRKQGLRSVVVKKYNHHSNHSSMPDDKENILKYDFNADTVNRKWCTDITYIHVQKEGWIYLASVMDLCSRKIIGYGIWHRYDGGTGCTGCNKCLFECKGFIGHYSYSDLGSQYVSAAFENCLAEKGDQPFLQRKGNPYDNACIEPFHSVLKKKKFISIHTGTSRKPGG